MNYKARLLAAGAAALTHVFPLPSFADPPDAGAESYALMRKTSGQNVAEQKSGYLTDNLKAGGSITDESQAFTGNSKSLKYHRDGCLFARIMSPEHRVMFSEKSKAEACGMKACNWCMPSWSATVEAKIIGQ